MLSTLPKVAVDEAKTKINQAKKAFGRFCVRFGS